MEWIDVNDKLPPDGQSILVFYRRGYITVDKFSINDRNWIKSGENVTHWMPLPEPPANIEITA